MGKVIACPRALQRQQHLILFDNPHIPLHFLRLTEWCIPVNRVWWSSPWALRAWTGDNSYLKTQNKDHDNCINMSRFSQGLSFNTSYQSWCTSVDNNNKMRKMLICGMSIVKVPFPKSTSERPYVHVNNRIEIKNLHIYRIIKKCCGK